MQLVDSETGELVDADLTPDVVAAFRRRRGGCPRRHGGPGRPRRTVARDRHVGRSDRHRRAAAARCRGDPMTFAHPAALWGLLATVPVVALHILRSAARAAHRVVGARMGPHRPTGRGHQALAAAPVDDSPRVAAARRGGHLWGARRAGPRQRAALGGAASCWRTPPRRWVPPMPERTGSTRCAASPNGSSRGRVGEVTVSIIATGAPTRIVASGLHASQAGAALSETPSGRGSLRRCWHGRSGAQPGSARPLRRRGADLRRWAGRAGDRTAPAGHSSRAGR